MDPVRALVSFVGGRGHLEPLLPLAALAMTRGYDVVYAGQASIVAGLAATGRTTVTVGPDTVTGLRRPLVAVDRELERRVVADHFVAEFGPQRDPALTTVIAEHGCDIVICDELDVGAVLAAERAGVPSITVGVLAAGRLTAPDVVGEAWRALRAGRGLPGDPELGRFGGTCRVTPAPASFRDPALRSPFELHHVRPPILDDADETGGAALDVYATLGTVFDVESGDLFDRVAEGLAATGFDALLTVGHHVSPDELPPTPARVRVEPFVPQRDVLGRCRAVVCHGGTGTTIAALVHGLPVVVLPMGADQPDNADRVDALGAGIVLDAVTAEAADIAAAVQEVLDDPSYRLAARRLADEAAAQPRIVDVVGPLLDGAA